jgi:hypothetical protein
VSRVQARADFLDSLLITKPLTETLIRWILETALRFAAVFSGDSKAFDLIRPMADCKPNTGPLAPDERAAIVDMVEKDLMSVETAMVLLGIDDPDAEKAKILLESDSLTFSQKLKLITALALVKYTLHDSQFEFFDKELGFEVRDQAAIDAENAQQLDLQTQRIKAMKVSQNPNDTNLPPPPVPNAPPSNTPPSGG